MNEVRNQEEEPMLDASDIAVDRWVHSELARTFNGVLSEAIPDDLMRLLGPSEPG